MWSGGEGLYGRPASLSATFTHQVINPTGYAGDHKGLCWRMKGIVQLSVRTPGVWEIRQETPFLPDEPGKADQKIDFSWGHSALHSFYHSPTESKGPPNPSQPPSPLQSMYGLLTSSPWVFPDIVAIGRNWHSHGKRIHCLLSRLRCRETGEVTMLVTHTDPTLFRSVDAYWATARVRPNRCEL